MLIWFKLKFLMKFKSSWDFVNILSEWFDLKCQPYEIGFLRVFFPTPFESQA